MTDQVNEALDYTPGELDRTAPERIWLQIDIGAGKDYRNEPFPTDIDGVTWHNEPIGGLEVQYVRADLATHPSRGVVDEIDPNSRNFVEGMKVGRAELSIIRKAIDTRQCDECGARNPEEAGKLCRPSGDSCPGSEWPLADLWDQAAATAHPSRGVVDEAMVERGARAAWEMVPRGVPWRDANDTIQDDWVRIARVILQAAALPAVPPVSEWTAVLEALDAVNEAANDARHRGEYGKANKLVNARVTLYRAALANEEAATPAHDQPEGEG